MVSRGKKRGKEKKKSDGVLFLSDMGIKKGNRTRTSQKSFESKQMKSDGNVKKGTRMGKGGRGNSELSNPILHRAREDKHGRKGKGRITYPADEGGTVYDKSTRFP